MGTRALGLWQGAALYVGAVLGTGILVLPAVAAETAGPASVLAWLALVVLSLPIALTFAAISREHPDAAGFSGAIERAFGSRWGAVAGWLFLAQAPTGYVIAALIAGEYAASVVGADGRPSSRSAADWSFSPTCSSIATIGTRAYGPAFASETPLIPMATGTFGPAAALIVGAAGFVLSFAPVNAYTAGLSRLMFALGRRRQLPAWLGVVSESGTPLRALCVLGGLCAVAAAVAYTTNWGIADLLPLSTSSFIATYVLSMAAAVRLLRPPLRYAAATSLAACAVVLFFVGPVLVWIGGITACSLGYQQLVARSAPQA